MEREGERWREGSGRMETFTNAYFITSYLSTNYL